MIGETATATATAMATAMATATATATVTVTVTVMGGNKIDTKMSELLQKSDSEKETKISTLPDREISEITDSLLPPLERKVTIEKDGIETEILCTSFSNRIVIFITQINKIGTLVNAWSESKVDGGKIYHTAILMGKRDDPLLTIYARQLIEKIAIHSNKPLLLGICLKEEGRSREQFQFIINSVLENLIL